MPSVPSGTFIPPPRWLDLTEDMLLRDCHFETFRGPGPGGQKRNKTSNAVRLVHAPTGITVLAGESRSQAENKLRAVKRLLIVSVLRYAEAVRPVTAFDPNLGNTSVSAQDLAVVKSLIADRRDDSPHLEEFHDPNLERLTELIAAKMAEGSVVA